MPFADRCQRAIGALLPFAALAADGVPAPVVAQGWRGGRRQALLARLLVGCHVEGLDDHQARAVGSLAARAGTPDVVDACVVEGALRRHDLVVSSDSDDLAAIATAIGRRLELERP